MVKSFRLMSMNYDNFADTSASGYARCVVNIGSTAKRICRLNEGAVR